MVERPIPFSASSVRAILADEKTQTRRVVRLPRWVQRKQPNMDAAFADQGSAGNPFASPGEGYLHVPCADDDSVQRIYSPFGRPGDRLWVREVWTADFGWPEDGGEETRWWHEMPAAFRGPASAQYTYYRDGTAWMCSPEGIVLEARWIPSVDDMEGCRWHSWIHMPRWASRLFLEVTAVRVERLQDITEAEQRWRSHAGVVRHSARRLRAAVGRSQREARLRMGVEPVGVGGGVRARAARRGAGG